MALGEMSWFFKYMMYINDINISCFVKESKRLAMFAALNPQNELVLYSLCDY